MLKTKDWVFCLVIIKHFFTCHFQLTDLPSKADDVTVPNKNVCWPLKKNIFKMNSKMMCELDKYSSTVLMNRHYA